MEVTSHTKNFDITAVCFEFIKQRDGLEFHKALCGDFIVIVIVSKDFKNGLINATKLCHSGGKQLKDWTRLQTAKNLISLYTQNLLGDTGGSLQHFISYGGRNTEDNLISGTYFHSDIMFHIASWISPLFASKVTKIVSSFSTYDFERRYVRDMEVLQDKFNQVFTELKQENRKLKLCAAPYTKKPSLRNCLVIIKKNTSARRYPYYVIRTQKRNLKKAMRVVVKKYPGYKIIFKKYRDPNSVKLFRLMVQELPIVSRYNSFNTSLSEDQLTDEIQELYDSLLK